MPIEFGTVVGSISILRYRVRMDDGSDIEAILTKGLLRKLGCFPRRLQDGLAVRISVREAPKQHKIIDIKVSL